MITGVRSKNKPLQVLLDENVPLLIKDWLEEKRQTWHVSHVLEVGLGGKTDLEVLAWAQMNQAIVITFDSDFINNPKITSQSHYGIIRLRIHPTTAEETKSALDRLLNEFSDAAITGALIIIGREKIRVRPGRVAQ